MRTGSRDRIERLYEAVRRSGCRLTPARRAILDVLLSSGDHLSAESIADLVSRKVPGTDRSTVYRSLNALEQIGVLDHVHLGHSRAVWHLADTDHHHLVCERCENVTEVPMQIFDSARSELERRYGFRSDTVHFAIVGLCSRCRAGGSQDSGPLASRS